MRLLLTLLTLCACNGAETPGDSGQKPPDSAPQTNDSVAPKDSDSLDDSPGDSVDSEPPVPARLVMLSAELELPAAEAGMRLRGFFSMEDAAGAPIACSASATEASFSLCPDASCAELWPAASGSYSAVCGDAARVAFLVAPSEAADPDALRQALAEADAILTESGGDGVLVLATDPPQTLPLSAAATADLTALADPAGALNAAREALRGVENRGLVVLLPDNAAADDFGEAMAALDMGGASLRVIGPTESLSRLPTINAELRPSEDFAQELVRAAGAYAEAARVLVRSVDRAMSCGELGMHAEITAGGQNDARAWSQRINCPSTMDSALQGQFFVDPMGGGLHRAAWRYGFGPRRFSDGTYSFHPGIDIEAAAGEPIVAAAPGVVMQAGPRAGYDDSGDFVVIDHGGGLRSWYLHMQDVEVSLGQTVGRGERIGTVGNSGATWAHLHFSLSLCSTCDADSLGHYSTQTINPAWLLPRPESAAHTVSVVSVDSTDPTIATVTLLVSAPGDELDFNTLNIALGGVFSDSLDIDRRLGCSDENNPTDGIWTVDPSPGPWTSGVSWTVTLGPLDLRNGTGSVSVQAIDLWGNAVSAP